MAGVYTGGMAFEGFTSAFILAIALSTACKWMKKVDFTP
jgi:hypothetical protein